MATSWKAVERIAQRVLRFARIPLSITRTPTKGPCIDMSTHEMFLPASLLSEGTNAVVSTIGHEVGHPAVFPRSSHWWTYYIALCKKLGYPDPHHITNVLADLFVNDWCLTHTPWKTPFRRWAKKFYRSKAGDPLWSFLCLMMQSRLADLASRPVAIADSVDAEAYRLLFVDRGTRRARFEALAELLKDRFAAPEVTAPEQVGHAAEGLGALDPNANPETAAEYAEWLQAVGELGQENVFETVQEAMNGAGAGTGMAGDDVARRALFDMLEVTAFREFLAVEESSAGVDGLLEDGPLLTVPWRIGDRLSELRLGESLRRHGVLVPGWTTVKRVRGPQQRRRRDGHGTLFLVVDTSGSMSESLAGVLVVGWAAVLGAKRHRDRVAVLEFSGEPRYLVPPGYAYGKVKDVLQSMYASGGTCICPALDQVIDVAKRERRKPTTLILTDTDVSEGEAEVLDRLRAIEKLGGTNVVCCPSKDDLRGWVRRGMRQELLHAFALGDLSSVRSALQALR